MALRSKQGTAAPSMGERVPVSGVEGSATDTAAEPCFQSGF